MIAVQNRIERIRHFFVICRFQNVNHIMDIKLAKMHIPTNFVLINKGYDENFYKIKWMPPVKRRKASVVYF